MSENIRDIPLDRIIVDERYQARHDGVSASQVRLLMESDPQTWPPLLVAPNGDDTYTVVDGGHRTEVARRRKLSSLPCRVVEDAGYPESVAANLRHGLPMGISDRKEAARWWASEEPGLSFREIGRRVGLSDKTVKRALETENAEPPQLRQPSDPLDRWLRQTYRLDSPLSPGAVKSEIDAYAEEDRAEVARCYSAIGHALTEASTPYLKGR